LIQLLGWKTEGPILPDMARDAAERKDFGRSADHYDRMGLAAFEGELSFATSVGFPAISARARAFHARAALAAGLIDEALAHIKAGLDVMPGDVDLAMLTVPELERIGRRADAAAIYSRTCEPYLTLAKEYPRSGLAHNGAAWMAAVCRRDLDAGLVHARKAVELEPMNTGYWDTLAEVLFQRGQTDQALERMRACVRAEPRRTYFAKQLARFQAGDRTIPPPDDDE
jgi:tetratricopeptide (TPR) repeat protein